MNVNKDLSKILQNFTKFFRSFEKAGTDLLHHLKDFWQETSRTIKIIILMSSLLMFILIMILMTSRDVPKDQRSGESPLSSTEVHYNPEILDKYFIYYDRKLTDQSLSENIIYPEEINMKSDSNYLKEVLTDSPLFDKDHHKIQIELNRLVTK